LKKKYPVIQIEYHQINKGGSAARNTAIENTSNPLLFCLDSDNILVPESVPKLKEFLLASGTDVAAFREMHYFKNRKDNIIQKWIFEAEITLADHLSGPVVPGASGNYMFTRESWLRAGGYPEASRALDAWGFGFRQLATGSKMMTLADASYFHRYGYDSYWVREKKKGNVSLTALQILIPFVHMIQKKDVDYIFSPKGRNRWFSNLLKRPLRVRGAKKGKCGEKIYLNRSPSKHPLRRVINRLLQSF
jgi:glycosyltransferase involved in cell wall biosynthesis